VGRVKNGEIWKCKWPLCWTLVVQWVEGDQWGMLSMPGTRGPMIFHHEADGTWLYTEAELEARLATLGATPTKLTLKVVCA
jgi:hypothetical protein